jgi:hypothetical protein
MIAFQILFILGWILHDWYVENRQNRKPNHGKNFELRVMIGMMACILATDTAFLSHPYNFPKAVSENIFFCLTTFAFFFPVGLNIARGKPWVYLGDSDFDRWVVKWCNPLIWYGILAILAMAGIAVKIYGIQVLWTGH